VSTLDDVIAKLTPQQHERLLKAATLRAWQNGNLQYKFHTTQKTIYKAIQESQRRKFFLLCSRRLGKTFMLMTMAFELAIKKPGSRILFLAPIGKNAAEIATDTARTVLKDAPRIYQPEYKSMTREFVFPGDSIVRLKGVNNEHADDLRGGAQDLIILDECGQMDNLQHIVGSICMPMTMTTQGRILMATTPPMTPGHDSAHIYEDLAKDECVAKFTILDAPHVSVETKREYLIEAGEEVEHARKIIDREANPVTTTARREYFCEFITDADSAVVPEFNDAARAEIIKEYDRPECWDGYVSMDPGMKDNTGILFGWVDFLQQKLVIEDETLLRHPGTEEIANSIKATEAGVFHGRQPHKRVSDVELRLISDLRKMHKLDFSATKKDDSMAAIQHMRLLIQQRKLIINPRCKNLIRQLRDVTWNHKATDFARAGERSIDGHYDLVAALKYMIRNVDWHHNPYPAHYFGVGGKLGLPSGSWVSPKHWSQKKKDGLSLRDDTPVSKRLARRKRRT
jgi:hypothetical protein